MPRPPPGGRVSTPSPPRPSVWASVFPRTGRH
nr:MAG TPA: hypothetical protein [Caudoviricetes sp.]